MNSLRTPLMLLGLIIVPAVGLVVYSGSNETAPDTLLTPSEASEVSVINEESTQSELQPFIEKQSLTDVLAILKARDEREMASAAKAIMAD